LKEFKDTNPEATVIMLTNYDFGCIGANICKEEAIISSTKHGSSKKR